VNRVRFIALGCLVCAGVSGCAKVQARTPTPPPVVALAIPAPPARVTIPVDLPEPEPAAASAAPTSAPARPRPDASGGRTPDRPAAAAPAPPPPVTEPPSPNTVLQTTADTSALEQSTASLLAEAQRNLNGVRYQDLNQQAKAQFDAARSFIKNAQEAVKSKNFMYAQQLASKAAAVARELSK
jgi:hypothetical protein